MDWNRCWLCELRQSMSNISNLCNIKKGKKKKETALKVHVHIQPMHLVLVFNTLYPCAVMFDPQYSLFLATKTYSTTRSHKPTALIYFSE